MSNSEWVTTSAIALTLDTPYTMVYDFLISSNRERVHTCSDLYFLSAYKQKTYTIVRVESST